MNIQNIKTILITVIIVIAVWFFKDWHFQISDGHTWRTLKLKLDGGSFIVDKGIKYVKI